MRKYIENNGIILKKNVDSNGNLFAVRINAEHKQIYKATVMLEGIPSEFHRVFIEGYTENIPHRNDLPEGTYNVDYNNGKVYFNPAEEGKFIVADYYSLGTELIKAERVVTTYLEGENFCLSFAEEIRQNQELRDALLKELEANPKIRIVESAEWVHKVESELEQSFLIDETIFNPVTDLITVFYNGDFLHGNMYKRIGCRVVLSDWEAKEGDVFSFIIYKHVVGTIEIGGDGSLMIDGSIGRHKLSEDVQNDLAIIPIHNEHITKLGEAIALLDSKTEELRNSLSDLNAVVEEQGLAISDLETKTENMEAELDDVAEQIDTAKGDFDTLKDKMDNIEEKALDEDIVIGTSKYRKLMSVDEDGEVNAHIDINGASFKELTVSKLNCDEVIKMGDSSIVHINIGDGENIQQVINDLPKYIVGHVGLNISGVHHGDINISGFIGVGDLIINLLDGCEIHGSIYINSCTCFISVKGNARKAKLIHDSTRDTAFRVRTSPFVNIEFIEITGASNTSKNAIFASFGSGIRVADCKISKFSQYPFYVNQCSRMYMYNCFGDDNTGNAYSVHGGSTLFLERTIPASTGAGIATTSGQVIGTATASGTVSGGAVTVEPAKVKAYSCSAMKSYRAVDGWKTTTNRVYMGKFNPTNPSSYNYYGLFVLGTETINSMKADLSSKTIKSVKMTIKRGAEGGLDVNGVNINIYGTTNNGSGTSFPLTKTYKTNIGSIKKGSSYTVVLPNSIVTDIINGTIKSIMLHKPDSSNYSIFSDVFSLEVTYV